MMAPFTALIVAANGLLLAGTPATAADLDRLAGAVRAVDPADLTVAQHDLYRLAADVCAGRSAPALMRPALMACCAPSMRPGVTAIARSAAAIEGGEWRS